MKNQKRDGKRKAESRKLKSNDGAMTRPGLGRMWRILGLLREGKYPNCTTIAAELEVSTKTVLRDLDCMRDRMELPIEYDGRRHGYYLTRPVEGFPTVPVTAKELFSVCVAHKAIEHYRGTPLEQPLELAFKKFAGQLDDAERFTLESLDEVLSFRPFAPEDADLKLFELVTRAVTERRALRFEYRKPGESRAEGRVVHPYHLMEFEKRWYLLAHDAGRGEIRKFVLGRMRGATVTEERFTAPAGFDPKEYFRKSLGVMTGSGDYQVVIEMDGWLTDVLRGRRWHPSQVWTELPGGGSQLRLRLGCLEEIQQYVLSWGAHASVVEPRELRERVGATAQEVAARYGGSGCEEGGVPEHEDRGLRMEKTVEPRTVEL